MFMVDDFVYSEGIEEVKPLTLNLSITRKPNGSIEGEVRKKIVIDLNSDFWIELFSKSLQGKPIRAPVIIVFRDPFGSACKLKELGLLKADTKILEE